MINEYLKIISDTDTIVCMIDLDWTLSNAVVPVLFIWSLLWSRKFYMLPLILIEYRFHGNQYRLDTIQYYMAQYPEKTKNIIESLKFNRQIIDMMHTKEVTITDANSDQHTLSFKNKNVIFILSSGADQGIVDKVAEYILKITNNKIKFDYIIGSKPNKCNIKEQKLTNIDDILKEIKGKVSIIYFGDHKYDIPIWQDKRVIPICVKHENNYDNIAGFQEALGEGVDKKELLLLPSDYEHLKKHY